MKVLVIGGTGTVGSHVVQGLLTRQHEVRVLTRSEEHAGKLPAGAHAAIGSLEEPRTLPPLFEGIDAVWMANALSQSETQQGLAAVGAARARGVKKFVYMSIFNVTRAPQIPHFASKVPVQNAIRESRMTWTFIQPNEFYQNDMWYRDAITQAGVYPSPIGAVGLNRVDVRDIADASVSALTQPGHEGKEYPVVGPDVLTGPMIAGIYSRHLHREVIYGGDDLERWGQNAKSHFPDWLVHDLKMMYAYFQRHGLVATAHDLELLSKVLGHPPRRFADFVAEIAPAWTAAMAKSA